MTTVYATVIFTLPLRWGSPLCITYHSETDNFYYY